MFFSQDSAKLTLCKEPVAFGNKTYEMYKGMKS